MSEPVWQSTGIVHRNATHWKACHQTLLRAWKANVPQSQPYQALQNKVMCVSKRKTQAKMPPSSSILQRRLDVIASNHVLTWGCV